MNVIGGVMLVVAGACMGGGAVLYNIRSINKAVRSVTREREGLKSELFDWTLRAECDRAYRKGLMDGRSKPMSDAEQFARTFEGRNVTFRGARARGAHQKGE